MNKKLAKLLRRVDAFCKLAGLVEVPPELLKQVQDWAVCCYAKVSLREFDKKISAHKFRIEKQKKEEAWSNELEKGFGIMSDFVYDYQNSPETWQAFKNWMASRPGRVSIPYFNDDEIDKNTGLMGVIDHVKGSMFDIWLYIYDDGACNFGVNIYKHNHPLIEGGNVTPSSVEEKKITPERIREILRDHMSSISELVSSFKTATGYYEIYRPETMKQLIIQRAKIAKLASKECDSTQKFSIPASSLPYVKEIDPKLKTITISADFESYRHYPNQNWLGLWSDSRDPESAYLGRVNVFHDLKKDFGDMGRDFTSVFEDGVSEIKDTVRHELIHFLQTAVQRFNKIKELGGLPGRKLRDKNVDYHGTPKSISRGPGSGDNRIQHELRDIEFYTRLSDTVHEFARTATKLPIALHPVLARVWVGAITIDQARSFTQKWYDANYPMDGDSRDPVYREKTRRYEYAYQDIMEELINSQRHGNSKFFALLKEQQPLKYQKAVKEFFKAVGV